MIVIVDYGTGNLSSVQNMLKKIGYSSIITSDKSVIESADKIILPGVGAFDFAIRNLKSLGLFDLLIEKGSNCKTPILGICLGMQLLTKGSEEGVEKGLGLIDARAIKFRFKDALVKLPIPHMGWNRILIKKENKLIQNIDNQRFYFVHSYAIQCRNSSDVIGLSKYGYDFVSVFEKENILGTQFHPEKSHKFGMLLLKNFVENY